MGELENTGPTIAMDERYPTVVVDCGWTRYVIRKTCLLFQTCRVCIPPISNEEWTTRYCFCSVDIIGTVDSHCDFLSGCKGMHMLSWGGTFQLKLCLGGIICHLLS